MSESFIFIIVHMSTKNRNYITTMMTVSRNARINLKEIFILAIDMLTHLFKIRTGNELMLLDVKHDELLIEVELFC